MTHDAITTGDVVRLTPAAARRYGMSASVPLTVAGLRFRTGYKVPYVMVGTMAFKPSDLRRAA
jgi:hypothetical protein